MKHYQTIEASINKEGKITSRRTIKHTIFSKYKAKIRRLRLYIYETHGVFSISAIKDISKVQRIQYRKEALAHAGF